MSVLPHGGFNYLGQLPAAAPTSPVRGTALGALLGLLGAWAWMASEREAVEGQRADQQVLHTHIKATEVALAQAVEQTRLAQVRREEHARQLSWQASRLQVLDSLEALAFSSLSAPARLVWLRHEGSALSVQAQMPAAQMEPWAQAVSARLPGWGAAELVEQESPAPPVSAGVPVRVVLRWAAPAQQVAP
jgi:hypothetical protein